MNNMPTGIIGPNHPKLADLELHQWHSLMRRFQSGYVVLDLGVKR